MATEVKIDNVVLTNQPTHVGIIPPALAPYPGAGSGKQVIRPETPPLIQVRWGLQDMTESAIVRELIDKFAETMMHMLSWTDEEGERLYHRNVVVPHVAYGQGPAMQGVAVDTFTLGFEEIRPDPCLVIIELMSSGVLTVGDGKAKFECLSGGGRILGIDGDIEGLGTGAGQTRIQVSNGATDYLSTPGDFVVASATNLMENQVLAASPTYDRGDVIELDIDGIPGNSDSENVHVYLYALKFSE